MLNPSRVEVPAPAPVILIPTNIDLATDRPPDNTAAAVPRAEASVVAVNVTAPEAARVVNAPVFVVEAPIGVLLILPVVITAPVIVLLVSVSVVARPTKVSVEVGSVNVPLLTIVAITGEVKVLLVNVSVPASVARVPVTGSVNVVLAVVVSAVVCAPIVLKLPPIVIVLPVLATPVPPY